MSDMIENFRAMDDLRKIERAELGQPCPDCKRLLPKAHPKILIPQGWCKSHKYRDPRPLSLIDELHARLQAELAKEPK